MFAGPAQPLHWLADCERRLNPRGLFHLNYIPPNLSPDSRRLVLYTGFRSWNCDILATVSDDNLVNETWCWMSRGDFSYLVCLESGCPTLLCNEADQGLTYGNSWKRVRLVGLAAGWLHAGNLGAGERG